LALAFLMLISFANSAIGAPRPGESCFDATAPPSGVADVCTDVNDPDVPAGGGSLDLGLLLPILGAAVVGAALALVLGYLFIRRRGDLPVEPADPGEWWTCKHCGSNNVIGSARCYACGTWQG
jgi:ABC-type branched-subunit amino acid transport system permease subunit